MSVCKTLMLAERSTQTPILIADVCGAPAVARRSDRTINLEMMVDSKYGYVETLVLLNSIP